MVFNHTINANRLSTWPIAKSPRVPTDDNQCYLSFQLILKFITSTKTGNNAEELTWMQTTTKHIRS
jgi:hypothetical protein